MSPHLLSLLTSTRQRLTEWPASSLLLAIWQAADEGMHAEATRWEALALFAECELATVGDEALALVGLQLASLEQREAA